MPDLVHHHLVVGGTAVVGYFWADGVEAVGGYSGVKGERPEELCFAGSGALFCGMEEEEG